MKKILILTFSVVFWLGIRAQSETFPLYFSQHGINGTAAYIGKAGAIGALGGDIMSAHYNPAGLGLYRSSEMTFSLGVDVTSSSSILNNLKATNSHPNFNFGNIGIVFDFNNGSKNSIRHLQLSFGVNRLMNFNNHTQMIRNNVPSSFIFDNVEQRLIDSYGTDVKGLLKDDWFLSGVIDYDTTTNTISSTYDSGTFRQIRTLKESGYLNEFSMSLSANIENWLYLGATLGIPFGDYTCKNIFSEEKTVGGNPIGKSYTYHQEQKLSVSGLNLKVGAIVRPLEWFRLGVAIHTPTLYTMNDDYFQNIKERWSSGGWFNTLTYTMQSPWKFIGSAAIVLGKSKNKIQGTLSFDYEYSDYSNMSITLEEKPWLENKLNTSIDNNFSGANTFRLGGEIRYGVLRGRIGYAHMGNPYKSGNINSAEWNYITCGMGYKGKIFSLDIGYVYSSCLGSKYYSYDVYNLSDNKWYADNSPASIDTKKHLVQVTFGIRF
ncbi:MAG: OmpP1/FadL family transporter [Bacteroidales bacterium]